MLYRFIARDLILVGAALGLWWMLAEGSAGTGMVADLSGWIAGLMMGVCAYLAHEWSHYLAAVAMRSRVQTGTNLASGFLFSFDAEGNRVSQFVVMSLAGFVATAAVLFAFYTYLPEPYLATRIARGSVVFLALLGVTLELPLLLVGVFTKRVPNQVAVSPASPAV